MDLVGTTYIPSTKLANESTDTNRGNVLLSKTPKWCYETSTLCEVSTKNMVLFTSSYPLHLHHDSYKSGSGGSAGLAGQPGGHGLTNTNSSSTANQTFGSLRGGSEYKKSSDSNDNSHYVFVADLNTPWDIVLVTSRPTEIKALSWDMVTSEEFIVADGEGYIETWHMNNSVITDWSRVAKLHFPDEHFIKAKFIHNGRRIYVNLDKQESVYFKEKFTFCNAPQISQQFNEENIAACLLISATGLAVLFAYSLDLDMLLSHDISSSPMQPSQSLPYDGSSGILCVTQNLGVIRGRVRQVDIALNKDGQLLVATSNGDPQCPIRFYSLVPRLTDNIGYGDSLAGVEGEIHNKILSLEVNPYPGIFIKSASNEQLLDPGMAKGGNGSLPSNPPNTNEDETSNDAESKKSPTSQTFSSENHDICQSIVDLCFVECDDNAFSILVATQHPSGGRVELWELKETQLITHKIFLPPEGTTQNNLRSVVPVWQYQEIFVAGSSSAQVVKISTPHCAFQTGRASACYVTVCYTDGSIQCILRDKLQQIGCVDIPKSGNLQLNLTSDNYSSMGGEPSAAKISRMSSVSICDASFSANGNVLIVIDSLGQFYFYRMSPISDPGGPHTPDSIVLMLTKCLLSGYDWWDISICCGAVSLAGNKFTTSNPASMNPIDVICEKMTEDFNKQPTNIQHYYLNRWMSIKASVYRLAHPGWGNSTNQGTVQEYKAADTYMESMLVSIHGVFKSLLRPGALIDYQSNDTAFDKVSKILTAKMKDEINVDRLADLLDTKRNEFSVDPNILQSFHHLVQWTTDLALNLCARVPELKGPTGTNGLHGPGASLLSNTDVLIMLRELLLLIRLWGKSIPAGRPVYTKTSADESFDVLPKLFHIVTKLITTPENLEESLLNEAALLPCHIMIPPLHHTLVCARGMAPALNAGQTIAYEFGSEPQQDIFLFENTYNGNCTGGYGGLGVSPTIFSHTSGAIDCVKHMFLGKWPFSVKRCTRYVGI